MLTGPFIALNGNRTLDQRPMSRSWIACFQSPRQRGSFETVTVSYLGNTPLMCLINT
jgi:hypothetical protein